MMSASAPAGSASSISGMLSAASTSATIDGDDESDVISQPAPTSCIHVPTLETIVAIHRLRKSRCRKGLHAEGSASSAVESAGSSIAGGRAETWAGPSPSSADTSAHPSSITSSST